MNETKNKEYVRCLNTIHSISYAGATIMGTTHRGDPDELEAFLYWAFTTIHEAELDLCALEMDAPEGSDHE